MNDLIEKVKNGLDRCKKNNGVYCIMCPYSNESKIPHTCNTELCHDALSVIESQQAEIERLKKHESKWIHRADMDYKDKNGVVHFHGMCESCGFIHDFLDEHTGQYKFCPECGSKNEQWKGGEMNGRTY